MCINTSCLKATLRPVKIAYQSVRISTKRTGHLASITRAVNKLVAWNVFTIVMTAARDPTVNERRDRTNIIAVI